jgi:2-oxoglutarate dehydrogenase complex, dehydrogenase (E1) component, and related enzymes
MTLREMMAELEKIYADAIGAEFMHIQNTRIRNWVLHRLESRPDKRATPRPVQIALLRALLEAESFEIFLHSRYVGQKRFSLQGAESLMVILDTILHKCPGSGIEEICGMASRPAQCAGELPAQIAQGDLHRVHGKLHSRTGRR